MVLTALADVLLVASNLLHLFVLVSFLHPVESPLKKGLLKAAETATCYQTQLTSAAALITLAIISLTATYKYWCYAAHDDSAATGFLLRAVIGAYSFLSALFVMKVTSTVRKLGVEKVMDFDRELLKYDIVNFAPPPLSLMTTVLAPAEALLRPDVNGLDNIPAHEPVLFVMNHSLMGIEMPFFIHTLYREKGIFVRGLTEHLHFAAPSGSLLKRFGAVDGTRDNVDVLMQARQHVLVYPGGAHEVMKHSSVPKYELLWKERLGFTRLAIKHGYPIVPCCAVGTEDMMDIIADIRVPYRGLTVPLVTTAPHRFQKIYFWFGKPIPTAQYKGDFTNTDFCVQVRDKAKMAIESGIQDMLEKQECDPQRFLTQQVTTAILSSLRVPPALPLTDESSHGSETDERRDRTTYSKEEIKSKT